MKSLGLSRHALTIGAAGALLAGCGGSQPLAATPGVAARASAHGARANNKKYKVVYSFGAAPDGAHPQASLIEAGGTLYGTTSSGGPYSCNYGCGTVFSVTLSDSGEATEKVLHGFGVGSDGQNPLAALLNVNGTLYGTTRFGGTHGDGTVFSITTGGTENVVYNFGGYYSDGDNPQANLIDVNGTLYGTTKYGGGNLCKRYFHTGGAVFSVTTGGVEKVLLGFQCDPDGGNPYAGLLELGGKLYGTTDVGGRRYFGGTVFRITTGGTEKVLHRFGSAGDGSQPQVSLTDVNGVLYGTTSVGGKYNYGTVFSITPRGKEKVLYSFAGGGDGVAPTASLIDVNGTLYGTTSEGGTHPYDGTVFSITPAGTETVLHSFQGGADGSSPAGLIDVDGTLYGTTAYGGANGNGTVFALTP